MRLETFFEKFDQFADAPDAVTKMRELVLELAVQGKLVDQNPTDEEAMHLLAQIRERNAIPKVVDDVGTCAIEIEHLPASWEISSLGEVSQIIRGVSFPGGAKSDGKKEGNVACLRTASVQEEIDWNDLIYIPETFVSRDDQWVAPSDIMISMANSYALVGKVAIVREVPQRATFGAFLAAIRPVLIEPYYLLYVLRSPRMQSAFRSSSSQTTNIANISLGRMRPLPFPLPPLAEQKRIVAKVDELMALCDRLETQHKEREIRHAALTRAAIARFDEAPTPANLNFLFHPSCSVTPVDLRKTILNLAVRGNLVLQSPNDETAERSLARLGLTPTAAIPDKNGQQDGQIPESWSLVRFEDVAVVTGGVTLGRKLGNRKTVTLPYLRVANVKRGEIDVDIMKQVTIAEDEIERYELRENDLLMTEGGDWDKVGRAAIWRGEIAPCLHQNHIFRARMRSAEIEPFWFELYFNSPQGRSYFESASKQTTNLASINMRQVRGCPVPFPPLAEQHRILVKVRQLMGLVDQWETQLAASGKTAKELLDAVIHELLHPTADVIEFPSSGSDRASQRAAIGCYAIEYLTRNPSFGRVMLMKVCYLSETHLGVPLDWRPMRQAAGPWDPWLQDFESLGIRSDWFTVTEKTLKNDRSKIEYSPKKALKSKAAEAVAVLGTQKAEFDRLLNLFADKNTEEAEIITTLFAAWNDFLIDGKTVTDDEIIYEVRENWHESKERFTPALLQRWLDWMRRQRLTPQGHGPRTRQQLTFRLK